MDTVAAAAPPVAAESQPLTGLPRVLAAEPMTNANEHLLSPPQGVVILAVREMQSD